MTLLYSIWVYILWYFSTVLAHSRLPSAFFPKLLKRHTWVAHLHVVSWKRCDPITTRAALICTCTITDPINAHLPGVMHFPLCHLTQRFSRGVQVHNIGFFFFVFFASESSPEKNTLMVIGEFPAGQPLNSPLSKLLPGCILPYAHMQLKNTNKVKHLLPKWKFFANMSLDGPDSWNTAAYSECQFFLKILTASLKSDIAR